LSQYYIFMWFTRFLSLQSDVDGFRRPLSASTMAAQRYILFTKILFFSAIGVGVFLLFFFFCQKNSTFLYCIILLSHVYSLSRLDSRSILWPWSTFTLNRLWRLTPVYLPYELCFSFNPQWSSVIIVCDFFLVCPSTFWLPLRMSVYFWCN